MICDSVFGICDGIYGICDGVFGICMRGGDLYLDLCTTPTFKKKLYGPAELEWSWY